MSSKIEYSFLTHHIITHRKLCLVYFYAISCIRTRTNIHETLRVYNVKISQTKVVRKRETNHVRAVDILACVVPD